MDRVRFGRVLGVGARQAAKTLVAAVDAATAKDPTAKRASTSAKTGQGAAVAVVRRTAEPGGPVATGNAARGKVAQATASAKGPARGASRGLRAGTRRFGEAVWGPFVRLSGVLWLEVSGVFFGIFALLALGWGWKLRGAWYSSAADPAAHRGFIGAMVMLLVFGYFCVSNFARARRREHGR